MLKCDNSICRKGIVKYPLFSSFRTCKGTWEKSLSLRWKDRISNSSTVAEFRKAKEQNGTVLRTIFLLMTDLIKIFTSEGLTFDGRVFYSRLRNQSFAQIERMWSKGISLKIEGNNNLQFHRPRKAWEMHDQASDQGHLWRNIPGLEMSRNSTNKTMKPPGVFELNME